MFKTYKDIKNSPFRLPTIDFYLGKIKHYTPYFLPRGFNKNIISFRKLELIPQEEYNRKVEKFPWAKEKFKFKNLPIVRRADDWIFKLFGNYYWIQIGSPIKYSKSELAFKDKFGSPRHEWNPFFHIYFFHWQFCIRLSAPKEERFDDAYWEMWVWFKYYCKEDIIEAENTWMWKDYASKISTWNKKYLK